MKHTHNFIVDGERYTYDFGECTSGNGWAQMDTRQDAWYYGNWTNPFTLQRKSYAEGDLDDYQYESVEEYVAAIREFIRWNSENDYWIGVDPGFNEDLKARFKEIGLGDLLH